MSKKNTTTRVILNDGFDQPKPVSDLNLAFGGDMSELLPSYGQIPEEFKRSFNPWVKFSDGWFFSGTSKDAVINRDDVDPDLAWRHLSAIQGSWEPKHEHKSAAVAWLASRWFERLAA